MTKSIAIIGLGWIGKPLALLLNQQGNTVIGTATTLKNKEAMHKQGVALHQVCLAANDSSIEQLPIQNYDAVVIAITPGFKRGAKDYASNVASIVAHAQSSNVQQIVLISSTGIYTGLNGDINEERELALTHTKVQQLHEAEQCVLNFSGHSQVLRFAGLVGPERFPGSFLAGKKDVKDPKAKTHLLHQADAVSIVTEFINHPSHEGIYNCVSPKSTTREAFYQKAAKLKGLIPPEFNHEETSTEIKTIHGNKLVEDIQYTYEFDDLYQWLDSQAAE